MASAMSNYDDIDDLLEERPKPAKAFSYDDDLDLDAAPRPPAWPKEKILALFKDWTMKWEERYRWAVFWILNARAKGCAMDARGKWTPMLPLWEAQMLEHLEEEVIFWVRLEEAGVELLTAFDLLIDRKNLPRKQDPTNYLPSGRLKKEANDGRKSEQSNPHRKPRERSRVENAAERPSSRELLAGDN